MGPLNALSPEFGSRTIDLCNANDPICDKGDLENRAPHHEYVPGMTDQAATFVAGGPFVDNEGSGRQTHDTFASNQDVVLVGLGAIVGDPV